MKKKNTASGGRRADRVQRRSVIAGLAASLVAPQRLSTQLASAKIPRVGILTAEESEMTPELDAFREGSAILAISKGATSSSNFGWPGAIFPVGRSWRQNWWLYRSLSS